MSHPESPALAGIVIPTGRPTRGRRITGSAFRLGGLALAVGPRDGVRHELTFGSPIPYQRQASVRG